jgi:hypothetical protein
MEGEEDIAKSCWSGVGGKREMDSNFDISDLGEP